MGYIYMVENTINNKKYIGQTIREDIKTRWKYHKTLNSKKYIGQILFNAYKKYESHFLTDNFGVYRTSQANTRIFKKSRYEDMILKKAVEAVQHR